MANRICALVVGIQRYYNSNFDLNGPERDMRYIYGLLQNEFEVPRDQIIPKLDQGATYQGITEAFEELIEMVEEGDTALFYYSGHGGRWRSATEFEHLSGDKFDETLVCFDSRSGGVPDLADKELAWYFSRLSQKGAEVVAILDCCHAGGMVRHGAKGLVKQVAGVSEPRPLASYKGEWTAGEPNDLPDRTFLMLSAASRFQLAREYGREDKGAEFLNRGVLTLALQEALESNPNQSYPQLFTRIRLETLSYNPSQTPQLDQVGGFDPNLNFLTHEPKAHDHHFEVSYAIEGKEGAEKGWKLGIGAAIGLAPGQGGEVDIETTEGELLTKATIGKVGLVDSSLEVEQPELLQPGQIYRAKVKDLPIDPFVIPVTGPEAAVQALLNAWEEHPYPFVQLFARDSNQAKYQLRANEEGWELWHPASNRKLLHGPLDKLYETLKGVRDWEGLAQVESPAGPAKGKLLYQIQVAPSFLRKAFSQGADVLAPARKGKNDQEYRLFLKNDSPGKLYWYLLGLTGGFGVFPLKQDLLPANSERTLVTKINIGPEEGDYSDCGRMKLLASEFPIDVFRLVSKKLGTTRGRHKEYNEFELREWNAENLNFHTYQKLGELGDADLNLEEEGITFQGHSSLRAEVSLWSGAPLMIGPGNDPVPAEFLRDAGVPPLSFLPEPRSHFQLLGLTDIKGFEDLKDSPLVFSFAKLSDKEIWPLAWNGKQLWVAGKPEGKGSVALTDLLPDGVSYHYGGEPELRIAFFEISGQNVNLESLEGHQLAPILHP